MSLETYKVKSATSRFVDRHGTEEWTRVFEVRESSLAGQRCNFAASLGNILPGHDTGDVYAPCIHESFSRPSETKADVYDVTCIYRRPTDEMILRPGRGLLSLDTYATLKKEQVGVFREGSPCIILKHAAGDLPVGRTLSLSREDKLEVSERLIWIARVTDWAHSREIALAERAEEWVGKRGQFTYRSKELENLKCMRIELRRRRSNVALLDSRWWFARNPDGWKLDGIIEDQYYAVSVPEGKEVDYDPNTVPPTKPDGRYMAIQVFNMDSDVASGDADFTPIENYFTWLG